MKLKFKVQPYQTSAVESVVDCFAGQVIMFFGEIRTTAVAFFATYGTSHPKGRT